MTTWIQFASSWCSVPDVVSPEEVRTSATAISRPVVIGVASAGGYFWFYAAIGALMPFMALYYRGLGFSGAQLGILLALPSLGSAVIGPLLGALSDSLGIHRWVLRGGLVTSILAILLVARVDTFAAMLPAIALLTLGSLPIPPLLDAYALWTSERTGRAFGSLRLWGSLGYTATVLLIGWLLADDVSTLIQFAYAGCLAATLVFILPLGSLGERQTSPMLRGLRDVLAMRPLLLLLLVAYLLAVGAALANTYFGVHIDAIGGTSAQLGVAFAIAAISEIPVIAGAGWLMRHVGPYRLIQLAIVVWGLRFVAYSLITEPALIFPVQMVHGLSYGAFLIASVPLAHRLAGRARAATAQALLTAMSFGFGSITGTLAGGLLLDVIGTRGLFAGAALLTAGTLAVLLIGDRMVRLSRHVRQGPAG